MHAGELSVGHWQPSSMPSTSPNEGVVSDGRTLLAGHDARDWIDGHNAMARPKDNVVGYPERSRTNHNAVERFVAEQILFAQRRPFVRQLAFVADYRYRSAVSTLAKAYCNLGAAVSGADDNNIEGRGIR